MWRAPDFWHYDSWQSRMLAPLGRGYNAIVQARLRLLKPTRVACPVIVVGNVVMGGAGKTPACLTLGRLLHAAAEQPHYLLRGYGGSITAPTHVEPTSHNAALVGDEALLLAASAPTWVGTNRVASAKMAVSYGATALIVDDGLQSPHLHYDIKIMVVDGGYGFGNGHVFPAGPLRENYQTALDRVDAVLVIGQDNYGLVEHLSTKRPIWRGHLQPDNAIVKNLAGKRVFAFTGIGRPGKFLTTLTDIGANVVSFHDFPDHHLYTHDEIEIMLQGARMMEAIPVTTAKDAVRLPGHLRQQVTIVPVELVLEDVGHFNSWLHSTITAVKTALSR